MAFGWMRKHPILTLGVGVAWGAMGIYNANERFEGGDPWNAAIGWGFTADVAADVFGGIETGANFVGDVSGSIKDVFTVAQPTGSLATSLGVEIINDFYENFIGNSPESAHTLDNQLRGLSRTALIEGAQIQGLPEQSNFQSLILSGSGRRAA